MRAFFRCPFKTKVTWFAICAGVGFGIGACSRFARSGRRCQASGKIAERSAGDLVPRGFQAKVQTSGLAPIAPAVAVDPDVYDLHLRASPKSFTPDELLWWNASSYATAVDGLTIDSWYERWMGLPSAKIPRSRIHF